MVRNISTGRQRQGRGSNRHRSADRRTSNNPRQSRNHSDGRLRAYLPVHDQRMDKDWRRHGTGLSGWGPLEGHGNGPVPPYPATEHRHSDHRSGSRRRRSSCKQGWRTLPQTVRPGQHYMMGGVHTDVHGFTGMPGLYAAGEVACVSMNGANRLGSNSLTECLVFGAAAGKAAAKYAMKLDSPSFGNPVQGEAMMEEKRIFDQ